MKFHSVTQLRAYVKSEAKFGAEAHLDPDVAEAAADDIDKLRGALRRIAHAPHGKMYCADGHEEAVLIARAAIEEEASHD